MRISSFREKVKGKWFLSQTLGPEPNYTIVSCGLTVISTFSRTLSTEDKVQLQLLVDHLNKDKSDGA